MKTTKYKIIALIGEAGSGKDFLLHCATEQYFNYNEIISCTTRPKREREIDGINYYFLDEKTFLDALNDGQMLEVSYFNGWYYGTKESALSLEKVNIGVFNPEGIRSLLKHSDMIDLKVYYVRASGKERLMRQLRREHNPNVSEIIRRYEADQKDFEHLDFEYTILDNEDIGDVDNALLRLRWTD